MKRKLVLCLLLLPSGLLAFANPGRSHPIAGQPKPKQPFQALEFNSIRMIDRNNGWAQNARVVWGTNDWVFNDKDIWTTTNGGKSWRQVLVALPKKSGFVSAFFHDSKSACVAATDDSTHVIVFRTTDGGTSWLRSQLRQSNLIVNSCLSFCGAEEGWLMLIPDHGMNSSPGELYRPGDGGATWRKINSTGASPRRWIWEDAALPEFDNRHDYLVCGGSIAFRNGSTGWVWGSLASTTPSFLFITRDGGLNWQVQRLSLPDSLPPGRIQPMGLPRFFEPDRKEGILPAAYYPTDNDPCTFGTVLYHTHDGGLNWRPTKPIHYSGIWDFTTISKGWVWSSKAHDTGSTARVKGTLYRTEDGGVSWKPAGTKKGPEQYLTHGEDIVQLDFVDGENGWAIARDPHNLTQLLHTKDGGETWSAIPTKVQP